MGAHKKLVLAILSVLLLLISVVPAIQLYLNSADGHAYIRRKFNEALPAKFIGTVNFKHARLAMFSGVLAFDTLSVLDNQQKEFASIPLAVAKFTLFDLLKPHTTIDSLILIGPKCSITSDQLTNIWKNKGDSLPPPKPDLIVNSFIVRFGDFSYANPQKELIINSRCQEIYSEFDFPANYFFLNLKKTKNQIRYTFLKKNVNTDYITIKVANGRLYLSDGKISSEGLDLELGGSVDKLFTEPYFHLNISTSFNSRTFFGHLPAFRKDAGKIFTKVQLNGTLRNPDFRATLRHNGGIFWGVTFDSLLANVSYYNNFLTIKKAALSSRSGRIKISGLLDFQQVFNGRLFAQNPDYNALRYTIRADGDDVLRLFTKDSLFSALPLKGFISWRGSGIIPQFMNGLIHSELSTTAKDSAADGKPNYLKLKSELSVSSGKVKVQKNEILHNGTLLNGSGEYNLFTGIFDLQFKGISGILPPGRIFAKNQYKTVIKVKGSHLKSDIYAEITGVKGNQPDGVHKGIIRSTLYPNGKLTINKAELIAKNGSCQFSGSLSAPYFLSDHFTNAKLSGEISVSDLSYWWPESDMHGSAYGTMQLTKNGSDLEIDYNIGATGLNIESNRSNLAIEGGMKGNYENLAGNFKADLIRNNQSQNTLIKLSGTVQGSDVFLESVSAPSKDNRRLPSRNLSTELNFVDVFFKKLNNSMLGKVFFHTKSR